MDIMQGIIQLGPVYVSDLTKYYNLARRSVVVQRNKSTPFEKDTLASDLPADLVSIVKMHNMIPPVCETV